MTTLAQTLSQSPRRLVATFFCVTSAAVVAGGAGGYLVHGTSTVAGSALPPAVVAPADVPALPLSPATHGFANADSQSGYGAPADAPAPHRFANADSQSGYGTPASAPTPHALTNADSQASSSHPS